MLKFEGPRRTSTDRLSSMSPRDYLDWCKAVTLEQYLAKSSGSEKLIGVRVDVVEGHPVPVVTDATKLKSFLVGQGASEEYAERAVERIRSGRQAEDHRNRWAAMDRRIENFRGAALKLCGPYGKRIAKVPVGVAFHPFLNAGAGFVPAGGDIVLLNVGIDDILSWAQFVQCRRQAAYHSAEKDDSNFLEVPAEVRQLARSVFGTQITVNADNIREKVNGDCTGEARGSAELMRGVMEAFIILHEFGHIARGHTDAARNWIPDSMLSADLLIERRAIERGFEFEADAFALDALCGVYLDGLTDRPKRAIIEIAVADLFGFMFLGSEADGGPPELLDHPTAKDRKERLVGVDPRYPTSVQEEDARYMRERFAALFEE